MYFTDLRYCVVKPWKYLCTNSVGCVRGDVSLLPFTVGDMFFFLFFPNRITHQQQSQTCPNFLSTCLQNCIGLMDLDSFQDMRHYPLQVTTKLQYISTIRYPQLTTHNPPVCFVCMYVAVRTPCRVQAMIAAMLVLFSHPLGTTSRCLNVLLPSSLYLVSRFQKARRVSVMPATKML